jgi:hypothetical protein
MKTLPAMAHLPVKLSALAALLVLTACGGGGGETVTTTTYVAPPPLALQSSSADLSKYANATWISECGTVFAVGTGQQTYQINTISLGTPVASTIPGTISISRYTQNNCSGTFTSTGGAIAANFKHVGELTVTSGSPVSAQGKADQFLVTETTSKATQTFTTGFTADYTKFYGSSSSYFSSTSLPYKKFPL